MNSKQVIHETVYKLKHDLKWQGQMEQQSDMLWLQKELNDGNVLLVMLQAYVPHIKIIKTDNLRVDAWRAFISHWPSRLVPSVTPVAVCQHAKFLSYLMITTGEMHAVSVMTTITVAYLFHAAIQQPNRQSEPIQMTPIIELAEGEIRMGMQLYNLQHYQIWLNDHQDLQNRLLNLRRLAEWHLWWGLSLLESPTTDAAIYFFRSLLGDGVKGISQWISSRNDVEGTYTTDQIDQLYIENEYVTLPPFGGSTSAFRTYVLLPFQRLCRYPLLLQSIKHKSDQQHETHTLNILQNQLDSAISQINLDRKSADLQEEVVGRWAEVGKLLLYVSRAKIRFNGHNTSHDYAIAFYTNYLVLIGERAGVLYIKSNIPRSTIYNFSQEREAEILLSWFDDNSQIHAHFTFSDNEGVNKFMRQLAVT